MQRLAPFAFLLVLFASSAGAEDPPAPTRLLTDNVGILKSSEVKELERMLSAIEKYELAKAIVYIDRAVPPSETLEAYTLRLASAWKVGDANRDDGIVIFVFVDDRRMRIEVGLGLEEVLTNDEARNIIDNKLKPAFRDGRFAQGLASALQSMAQVLDVGRARARRP
ncbi:MAG TPA: TPM domain-containing protein [Thermoanaerobaculia bacterium]|jgi:uncharacterized protein|nr:TPM domain-containing protein [Thermoanaerobaculia bacterium]